MGSKKREGFGFQEEEEGSGEPSPERWMP